MRSTSNAWYAYNVCVRYACVFFVSFTSTYVRSIRCRTSHPPHQTPLVVVVFVGRPDFSYDRALGRCGKWILMSLTNFGCCARTVPICVLYAMAKLWPTENGFKWDNYVSRCVFSSAHSTHLLACAWRLFHQLMPQPRGDDDG